MRARACDAVPRGRKRRPLWWRAHTPDARMCGLTFLGAAIPSEARARSYMRICNPGTLVAIAMHTEHTYNPVTLSAVATASQQALLHQRHTERCFNPVSQSMFVNP
eukprot:363264-Chlamydomonas_euryale.AAC.9